MFVGVSAAASALGGGVYGLSGQWPRGNASPLLWIVPLLAVLMWVHEDARRSNFAAVHDWGLFLWLAWPIVLPWYVFKTRGRAGWKPLVLLLALIAAPEIGAVVAMLLRLELRFLGRVLGLDA